MTPLPATPSALEVGKRLARLTARADIDADDVADDLRSLVADLVHSHSSTQEDALSLSIWAGALLREVLTRLPSDSDETDGLRNVIEVSAALTGRAIETLEALTGIPSAALSGDDQFSQ